MIKPVDVQVLCNARSLLAAGGVTWLQGTSAEDENGLEITEAVAGLGFPGATCWCAGAAIEHAAALLGAMPEGALKLFAVTVCHDPDDDEPCSDSFMDEVVHWNDARGRRYVDVLDGFDLAVRAGNGELAAMGLAPVLA